MKNHLENHLKNVYFPHIFRSWTGKDLNEQRFGSSLLPLQSSSKLSELTLPVEDSQDLFRIDSPSLTVAMDTQQGADTQNFRFSYEVDETQTQFLDENGWAVCQCSAFV